LKQPEQRLPAASFQSHGLHARAHACTPPARPPDLLLLLGALRMLGALLTRLGLRLLQAARHHACVRLQLLRLQTRLLQVLQRGGGGAGMMVR
jgi:hypothetical protein